MKQFHEQFKDRIDGTDGTVVLREEEFKQIQTDAAIKTLRVAAEVISKKASQIYVGNNPIREGMKRGMSDAAIAILEASKDIVC